MPDILETTMKLQKLFIALAAILCAGTVFSARADLTNIVTLSVTTFTQAPTNSIDGTNTSFGKIVASTLSTSDLITEIGLANGRTFSKSAKLILIDDQFAIIDNGTLIPESVILTIQPGGENDIQGGIENGFTFLAFPTLNQSALVTVLFDDTSFPPANHLKFVITGLATGTVTDTRPSSAGIYNETMKVKVSSMTGEGLSAGNPIVITGTMSVSGKGTLGL